MRGHTKLNGIQPIVTACAALLALAAGSAAHAAQVKLQAELDKPWLLAGKTQKVYLRVGLTGMAFESEKERTPLNVALVLDRSGSMTGEKIAKAKESAILAVQRLDSRDILSFITYDTTVSVLIPATRVSDKEALIETIRSIRPGNTTALFAGVSKGAAEVRKFRSEGYVNRVILLSDGLANAGPSSPEELGALGLSLLKEGISVTTIGLGADFNSNLMTALAEKSDGAFYFAEKASDLSWAYDREFGRALSVAARRLQTEIHCSSGVRPVRVLGREAEIDGQSVWVYINDLYSEKEKHVLLQLEVPAGETGSRVDIASVRLSYLNPASGKSETVRQEVALRFTDSEKLVEESMNSRVVIDTVELLAVEQRTMAYALRDQGKVDEARSLLSANETRLREYGSKYQSQKLLDYATEQNITFANPQAYRYDPTNGTVSAGDLWRVKQ